MQNDLYSAVSELDRKTERNRRDIEIVLSHLKSVGLLPDGQHGEKSGTSGSGQIGVVKSPV